MRSRIRLTLAGLALAGLSLSGCATPAAAPPVAQSAAAETSEAIAPAVGPPQTGKASWYGRRHHGRRTASGEPFDRLGMTAAHPRLPFGTRVRVTSLATGQSVIVRVNDRCRCPGVMIDLSEGAARSIGLYSTGPVRMERL